MPGGVFSPWQIGLLAEGLRTAAVRQEVLADNVANADTPGFKRREVRFGQELRRAQKLLPLATSDPRHMSPKRGPESVQVVRELTSGREDGNNVDIEFELASLAENGLWQQAMARQLSARFDIWRTVITEGRR